LTLLAQRAAELRALHRASDPLLLPNAWDAASARAVVDAGFPAVATTSGGVAASLGWKDREQMPVDEAFAAIGRIARSVSVPTTADVEGGYGLSPKALVERLLGSGAVGLNLEDSDHRHRGALLPAETQAERIAAVKGAGRAVGVDLVLNARVDVFIDPIGDGEELREAIRRATIYADAGADCIFPILVAEEAAIEALVRSVRVPVNILAVEGTPPLTRLSELGVARISFGSRLHRMAVADHLGRLQEIRAGRPLKDA
jgi:2-methylisocitrate lyase-like PEP mutase family enzyme